MELVRIEGMQYKPYLTKLKVELVSEDETGYVVNATIDTCCTVHKKFPQVVQGVRYPRYAWSLVQ